MLKNFLLSLAFVLFVVPVHSDAAERQDITAEQAKSMIDTNSELIIVDVREYAKEYCQRGHIPCALNYPWNSGLLNDRYQELPKTADILVV